jgi:hypothetical protein
VYDAYESGVKISRIIHSPDNSKIQCFQAHKDNFDLSKIKDFTASATAYELNKYYGFIQLESQLIDIYQYGNLFPIYDKDISVDPNLDDFNEPYSLASFFNFSADSRITTTRFDIEYFSPLTIASNTYKRIRWAGVPAIKFYKDSRLIIPLDYYSIVANHPKAITPAETNLDPNLIFIVGDSGHIIISEENEGELLNFSYLVAIGDIVKINATNGITTMIFYGIIDSISSGTDNKTITLEPWNSSRFLSSVSIGSIPINSYVTRLFAFDGMFSNIMDINEDINQRFSVVENISAQNNQSELYNYINQGGV